ncbi:MAG: hypothetical protein EPO35_12085 [Acidobacteria bacterium]|nr:MAG: hypothetical protein EPO35_12085 [Acidobacteriota bacterium]
MARVITLTLCVAFGLVFLSRSCTFARPGGPIALKYGRIVSGNGTDQTIRFVAVAGGRITAVSLLNSGDATPSGAHEIDVSGLYVAAATFDRTAPTPMDGLRHVWVGQMSPGDPGDLVILRGNPSRIRPGQIPDADAIVAAVINGRYYTGRELLRRR